MSITVVNIAYAAEVKAEVKEMGNREYVDVSIGELTVMLPLNVSEAICDALRFHQLAEYHEAGGF